MMIQLVRGSGLGLQPTLQTSKLREWVGVRIRARVSAAIPQSSRCPQVWDKGKSRLRA